VKTYERHAYEPGSRLFIGGNIPATVEEVIWARGMETPFYLMEYWHEGHLIQKRVHAGDVSELRRSPSVIE
jgi:hypothetical protein